MNTALEELEGVYPMRVVTRLTGLSADTIRVWERRYRAVNPERTDGGKRRYSSPQVRRLSLLRRATELGHTISEVANLNEDDLERIIASTRAPGPKPEHGDFDQLIDDYLEVIAQFDVRRADEILTRTAAIMPPLAFSLQFILPLIRRVGDLWCTGDLAVAQEHIVSSQLRSLLGTLMRHVTPPIGASRIVVAAPEGHRHEFGAFVGAFIAASRGLEPIYLGADLPAEQIALATKRSGSDIVLLSVVRDCSERELADLRRDLTRLAAVSEVWLGVPEDHAVNALELPLRCFHRYEDVDAAIMHLTT